ncbi:MAG TPA: short-chain dehydrogenase, partial [Pseudomonas sp.]|nr:short-chain dehydrogenase [Pseudomonas sp.]
MPKNILIVGASRGLGLGLAKQFSSAGWQVIATVRDPQRAEALNGLPQLRIETLDINDAASVDQLAARLAGTPIDV